MTSLPNHRSRGWQRVVASGAALVAAGFLCAVDGAAQAGAAGGKWFTAWATSQQGLNPNTISNASIRMIARVTVPGDAVRIRLDNAFGTEPVRIARVFVGQRIQGAALAPGSNRPVTFNQAAEVVIPVGGTVMSDPVPMTVYAQQDLAVSMFVPGANVRPSQHGGAAVTSYRTADGKGDVVSDESRMPWTERVTNTWWLKAIDVQSTAVAGTIVAFGDSITDGTCTTLDANDRWVNVLSVRLGLQADAMGRRAKLKAVVNEGIGGNTATRENLKPAPDSPPGMERLERDVLSHSGVTDVILFMGTNDLRRDAPVEQVQKGLESIISRIKAKKLHLVGVTIIPRHNAPVNGTNTGWDPEKTARRNVMNEWLKKKAGFDGLIDFDATIRDPKNPDLMLPAYNCGDGIHPSPLGYYVLGRSIPLSLFGGADN